MNEKRESLSDAELISRSQSGDLDAFGELYQRYLTRIYRYLRSRVTDERTAEDLTEAVFIRCFEALGDYEERGLPFSAYLYRVARNRLTDHYRSQREPVPLEGIEDQGTEQPSLEEQILIKERQRKVQNALAKLPEDYQEVIRLRVLLDLSTQEAAAWLDRSPGAVRVLLHRALKMLKQTLDITDE
jgi:RNA polymerase sigma-70 factor (ECF subfamily)